MRQIAQILCVVILFGSSCKTTENVTVYQPLSFEKKRAFEDIFYKASKQKVLNNQEKAMELFSNALQLNPQSHACMYELSHLNYDLDNYRLSLHFAQQAIKNATEYNYWYFDLLVRSYIKLGLYEQSAEVLLDMTALEPNNMSNYLKAADAFKNIKEYDKAIDILEKMQSLHGIEHESTWKLENIYSITGQHKKAIEVLENIVQKYPDEISYLGRLSEAYDRDGQEEKVFETLHKIIQMDSTSGKANIALYVIYTSKNEADIAFDYLVKSFRSNDMSMELKLQAISPFFEGIKSNEKQRNKLHKITDILLSEYPSNPEVYLLKADIHGILGEYKIARKWAYQAMELDAMSYSIWKKIIFLNEQLYDTQQQLFDVQKALGLYPHVSHLYFIKSKVLCELDSFSQALSVAKEGIEMAYDKEDKLNLLVAQANSYVGLKSFEEAKTLFEQVLLADPYHILGLKSYSLSLANQGIQLDEALFMIEKALIIQPQNADLIATKAAVLFAKKERINAINLLNKAISLAPLNKLYYHQLEAIYIHTRQHEKVDEINQKIHSFNEDN